MTMRKESSLEVKAEYFRLQQNYPKLCGIITGPAIMAAWLLLGDDMWVKEKNEQRISNGNSDAGDSPPEN